MRPLSERRNMISKNINLSIIQQCKLLDISRSGLYYKPSPESEMNLKLMRLMDEHYLEHPYKGAGRMHTWLVKDMGLKVSLNRVSRLYYDVMGLRSMLPGPHTSKRNCSHKIYPYLLRGLKIEYPNQVWATDITYIPMSEGFMYLIAVIDLYSRYVINWSLSNSMEAEWCVEFIQESFELHGMPEILNTDQGSQFTSNDFTEQVLNNDVKLSMDGRGRATDNAFIERLWRSVKYEKIYLNPPSDGLDLHIKLNEYFNYYNMERRHSSIGDVRPSSRYFSFEPPLPALQVAQKKNSKRRKKRIILIKNDRKTV